MQDWVPEEAREESRAALLKVVKMAEAVRSVSGVPRKPAKP